jgi:hypothetical protein
MVNLENIRRKREIKMSDYKILQQGLDELDREKAKQYYYSYIKYGTNQKHPIDAIFDLIELKIKRDKKCQITKHTKVS